MPIYWAEKSSKSGSFIHTTQVAFVLFLVSCVNPYSSSPAGCHYRQISSVGKLWKKWDQLSSSIGHWRQAKIQQSTRHIKIAKFQCYIWNHYVKCISNKDKHAECLSSNLWNRLWNLIILIEKKIIKNLSKWSNQWLCSYEHDRNAAFILILAIKSIIGIIMMSLNRTTEV